jgi:hypothetical protein
MTSHRMLRHQGRKIQKQAPDGPSLRDPPSYHPLPLQTVQNKLVQNGTQEHIKEIGKQKNSSRLMKIVEAKLMRQTGETRAGSGQIKSFCSIARCCSDAKSSAIVLNSGLGAGQRRKLFHPIKIWKVNSHISVGERHRFRHSMKGDSKNSYFS